MLYAIKVDNRDADIVDKKYHIFDSNDYTTQLISFKEVLELLNKKVEIAYIIPRDKVNVAKYGVQALKKWREKYGTDMRITTFFCQVEYGKIKVNVKGDWCMLTVYGTSKKVLSFKTHVFYKHTYMQTLDTTVNDYVVKDNLIFADTDMHVPVLYWKGANVLYNANIPFALTVQQIISESNLGDDTQKTLDAVYKYYNVPIGYLRLNHKPYSIIIDSRTNIVSAIDGLDSYMVENFKCNGEYNTFTGDLTLMNHLDSQAVRILSVPFIKKMQNIVKKSFKDIVDTLKGSDVYALSDKFVIHYINYLYRDYLHDMCIQMKTGLSLEFNKQGNIEIYTEAVEKGLLATLTLE